jgi:predicted outer membrane repeat protein
MFESQHHLRRPLRITWAATVASLLASTCFFLAVAAHVRADTLWVCAGPECEFKTVWGAADNAHPGDTIMVKAGTYYEPGPIYPMMSVTITSESGPEVTILQNLSSRSMFNMTGVEGDPPRVVQGFTIIANPIHGTPTDRGGAFYIANRSRPIVAHNVFSGCLTVFRGAAICIEEADTQPIITDNIFVGNEIIRNPAISHPNGAATAVRNASRMVTSSTKIPPSSGGAAIDVYDASPIITHNTFIGNHSLKGGGAILVESPNAPLQESIITNNTFEDNSAGNNGGAILVQEARARIQGNTIISNSAYINGGGIYALASTLWIQTNIILSNTAIAGGGIWENGAQDDTVKDNLIAYNRTSTTRTDALGGGLAIFNAKQILIDSNVIRHNSSYQGDGLFIQRSLLAPGLVTVSNNVLTRNGQREIVVRDDSPRIVNNTIVGTGTTSNSVGIDLRHSLRPVIVNNIVAWEQVGMKADISSTVTVQHNDLWGNQTNYQGIVPDASNMSLNPQLVDTLHADYHLKAGSPLIDAGSNADAPDHDMDGDPRLPPVDGNGDGVASADIGADEYIPGSATDTPTPTPTGTPAGTPTPTVTAMEPTPTVLADTPTPTATWTPIPTSTPTATLTPTSMRTASPTPTPTRTGTPTSPAFRVYLPSILAPATEAVLHNRKAGERAWRLAGW